MTLVVFLVFFLPWFGSGDSELTPPTTTQIAEVVATTYEEMVKLEFTATISNKSPPRERRCEIKHGTESRVVLRVYEQTSPDRSYLPVYDFRTTALIGQNEIWISEDNYLTGEREQYVLPAADFYDYNTWDPKFSASASGCDFAGYFWSWVGKESLRMARLKGAIAGGTNLGTEIIDGHRCWVVCDGDGSGGNQKYYVDTAKGLLRRWTKNVGETLIRDRVFHYADEGFRLTEK